MIHHFRRKSYDYDLIVLGSGGGGSVGAHYARSLGKKVALFEPSDIGGECPNWACVPTKALLHAAATYETVLSAKDYGVSVGDVKVHYEKVKDWKDLVVSRTGASHGEETFHKDSIHLIKEKAEFISPHEVVAGGKTYSAAKFLLGTGSKEFIPPIEGLEDAGYITFKQAVDLKKVPESIVIFGGGAVGCEFAQLFSMFGSKVILVNRSERILGKEDQEVSELVTALFENRGITVMPSTVITKIAKRGDKKAVHLKHEHHEEVVREVEEVLIATGKLPNLDFAPEKAGIHISDHRLRVNRYLQTNVSHIFAAGDLVGPFLFTHTANYQSYIAAHNAFAHNKIVVDYRNIPRCIFVKPEVASVGIGEKEALDRGMRIKKGITPVAVIGRANTSNELDGFVKVITDEKGVIIGGSIVAPRAGEMIHELALAIELRAKAIQLADMIHAYPTYSEAVKIACSLVE